MAAAWASEEECLLAVVTAAAACVVEEERQERKEREVWVKPWLQRKEHSSYNTIFHELSCEDENLFRNYLRITPELFTHLLRLVSPSIEKEKTLMRDSISPGERLEATLIFLANGSSYSALKFATRISQPSLSSIIPETCEAIYEALKAEYVKIPRTAYEWRNIAADFHRRWNFPNVLGAIDGKHIPIRPPAGSGSCYYNYKSTHSIVLLAVVDASYKFVYVDVGINGRISDRGVWDACSLKSAIENSTLDIPPEENLPGTEIPVPYVFLGGDAFPLKPYLMKPYPFRNQTQEQRIFSYRLSQARRTVENSFGILANRFRVFLAPINLHPTKVEKIVLASIALHNFLLTENSTGYSDTPVSLSSATSGTEPHKLMPLGPRVGGKPCDAAKTVRRTLTWYFNNSGSVLLPADRMH